MAPTDLLDAFGTCIGSNSNLSCYFFLNNRNYTFSPNTPPLSYIPNFESSFATVSFNNADEDLSGSYTFGGHVGPHGQINLSLGDHSGRKLLISGPLDKPVNYNYPVYGSGTWSYAELKWGTWSSLVCKWSVYFYGRSRGIGYALCECGKHIHVLFVVNARFYQLMIVNNTSGIIMLQSSRRSPQVSMLHARREREARSTL